MLRRFLLGLLVFQILPVSLMAETRQPNVIIIFTDDQGYGDLGVYGAEGYETPNIDRMAAEGVRFTDFYVSQAVCSASRAALLTGCYSNRVSILGALGPQVKYGLHPQEDTIADVLKQKGYATACFGKWHLGHLPPFLPTRQGFDEYFGLPYSNDMWPYHPTNKSFPDLPLIEGDKIIDKVITPDEQRNLTTWYTEHAVDFIERNTNKPFFLYVPHSMPHVPLFVSDKFKGKSKQGLYGDVIMEIDWSVGQILKTLKQNKLDEKTLVVFTTDNGPWLSYGNHAGSAKPLREGKGTAWDGGQRVPCVMRWPGQIPAGKVCDEIAGTIDLLPTIAHLCNADLPDRTIDGKNISSLMMQPEQATSPHDAFYFYWGRDLQAVRSGDWKLHLPHSYRSLKDKPGKDGLPGRYIQKQTPLALYNLSTDIGEQKNVIDAHPDVTAKLTKLAEAMRKRLGHGKQKGTEQRPVGTLDD